MKQKDWCSVSNLYFIAPIVFIVSLAVGMAFYMFVNDWDFSVAYFFASTVLLGNMYLIPTESSSLSQTFTLWYFLWGSSLLAGAVTALANDLVSNAVRVAADERQRILQSIDEPYDADDDGVVGFGDRVQYYTSKLVYEMGWYDYKSKYATLFIFCLWLVIGVLYGLLFEEWPLMQSIYFAFAAVSASGSSPPDCVGPSVYECTIGTARSFLMGTYIIVGVPLFAYTVGQFAGLIVEHAVRAKEHKLMVRPLTEAEFTFARQLRKGVLHHRSDDVSDVNSNSGVKSEMKLTQNTSVPSPPPVRNASSPAATHDDMTIDLGEFILLELLRLQKVDMTDLLCLKALFDEIDDSGDGVIDMEEIRRHNLAVNARSGAGDGDKKVTSHDHAQSKRALLNNTDNKFSYGALNQQDEGVVCDTPQNTVSSSSCGNLNDGFNAESTSRTSPGGISICTAVEEGRYQHEHSHTFNEHNLIDDDDDEDTFPPHLESTYSHMYNSMVIPVIQQLHEQSGVFNIAPMSVEDDEDDDNTNNAGDDPHSSQNNITGSNKMKNSPIAPILSYFTGRSRRNTVSNIEMRPQSTSEKSYLESASVLLDALKDYQY